MSDDAGTAGETGQRHVAVESLAPLSLDEALSIVGESTRTEIIQALGDARAGEPGSAEPVGFSDLMERVGVEDSGRFNYHLDKLVGTFVEKGAEGYELRLPGLLVYQAIVAGTLTERPTIDPFPVGECPGCDGDLTAAVSADHVLAVECESCERLVETIHVPPRAVADRSTADLLDAGYQRRYHEIGAMRRGVCHGCGGVVDRDLRLDAADEIAGFCDCSQFAVLQCRACHASVVGNPAVIAQVTPQVAGFFADHDRDAALVRGWDEVVLAARDSLAVVERDPPTVAVSFELDGDRLRVVLDDDLQVVDATPHDE